MGSLDREGVTVSHRFLAGNAGESQEISTARLAWQSLHLPTTGFVAGDLTYETRNEVTGLWVPAVDKTGTSIPLVAVLGGEVLPVPLDVNYVKVWRAVMSTTQPDNLEFATVNKT